VRRNVLAAVAARRRWQEIALTALSRPPASISTPGRDIADIQAVTLVRLARTG